MVGAGVNGLSKTGEVSNMTMQTQKKVGNGMIGGKRALIKRLGAVGVGVIVLVALLAGLGYFFIVRPAYVLVSSGNRLKSDFLGIGNAMQSRDLVELGRVLSKTQEDLNKFKQDRDGTFGWTKNVGFLKLGEFYSDSDRFVNAGLYGVDALREFSKIIEPFADAAGLKVSASQSSEEQSQGFMQAFQTWVSVMPQVAGQMDGVIEKVSSMGKELSYINVDKYPARIKGVDVRSNIEFAKNTLSKSEEYAPDIKKALTIIPGLLGVNTPVKRYMVIMQNDKELRPTGGFMTNYATFKMQNGLLGSDFTSKDMYSIDLTLDIVDAVYDFPDAPAPYMKYLKVERWYARDMNYSPDFTDSMTQFLKFYNMAGRIDPTEIKPIDGIIAIDTEVVREMLAVTGPVTVNGTTYGEDNVVLELEKIASLELREQSNRKRVLGDLMDAMLKNVLESDKNLWPKLIEKGIDLSVRKHVQAYLFDPEGQALVEEYNLGGRIFDPVTGDYSFVVSTNLGGDKTNWFVNKEVSHVLEKSDGKWIDTVKIKYTYKQPSDNFAPFIKRFRDWVRVYAPLGSEFISVDGSEDGTSSGQERGKVYFSGYVELGPSETKELTFKYYPPENVVGNGVYNLTIQKQAGIDKETHTVTVGGKTTTINLYKDTEVKIKM